MSSVSGRALFVWPWVAMLASCASISSVQSADTLGRGGFQLGIEPGVLVGADLKPTSTSEPAWLPHIDVSARWGVSDRVDLGFRAGLSLAELHTKFLFTTPGDPRLAISLAPTAGGLLISDRTTDGPVGLLNVAVPLLVGFKTSNGSELVIGPRVQSLVLLPREARGAVFGLGTGLSIGFAWRITERFGLMPEAALMVPIVGGEAFTTQFNATSVLDTGLVMVQFKLGVIIGRARKGPVPAPPAVERPLTPPPLPPPDAAGSPPPVTQ